MNIYGKTIARLRKIRNATQDEYEAILKTMKQDESEPLVYMDCANEEELLDAYGGGCITRKQMEEGKEFFKQAKKSKEIGLRDYESVIKALGYAIDEIYGLEEEDEMMEKANEKKRVLDKAI